ncbi:hypothetical protein K491DRAFT_721027 [Lophiostoma macrostomum CBS 122681]|uniref:Uncharacterized protein n=1 Tax=Lophiostoma macrostomum CBS 122681 TaxID=1314788 RepID=A0A6A6SUQ8_9PLEO|nr:hypothetical protein K491DRAFT_721027 [Lophiostoma macrostomum CBS 122681]
MELSLSAGIFSPREDLRPGIQSKLKHLTLTDLSVLNVYATLSVKAAADTLTSLNSLTFSKGKGPVTTWFKMMSIVVRGFQGAYTRDCFQRLELQYTRAPDTPMWKISLQKDLAPFPNMNSSICPGQSMEFSIHDPDINRVWSAFLRWRSGTPLSTITNFQASMAIITIAMTLFGSSSTISVSTEDPHYHDEMMVLQTLFSYAETEFKKCESSYHAGSAEQH